VNPSMTSPVMPSARDSSPGSPPRLRNGAPQSKADSSRGRAGCGGPVAAVPDVRAERVSREQWQQRAAAYVAAKKLADEASTALEAARAALVGLTQHSSESGAGSR